MCNQDHNDWDEKIDTILMGYRASSQASTKYSPYFMLFQKEMRLPIDNEIIPIGNIIEEGDLDKTMEILLQKKKELFQKVESNIKTSQQKQKETYDRKHLPKELAPGTEILIENTAQKERKGGKLDDAFLGPYTIHKSLGKGIYKVMNQKGVILKKKVNISRIKMYKKRDESMVMHPIIHYS